MVGYNEPRAATTYGVTPTPAKLGYFTTQYAGKDGKGDFHVNHFATYFKITNIEYSGLNGTNQAKKLAKLFANVKVFCEIFSCHNIASAEPGFKTNAAYNLHEGGSTVNFELGGNFGDPDHKILGLIHPDWVALHEMESAGGSELSFFGNTLKRNWKTKLENLLEDDFDFFDYLGMFTITGLLKALVAQVGIGEFVQLNEKHFLAGCRSWHVGFDAKHNLFFVETMAIERASSWNAALADKPLNVRDGVIRTWSHLLNNYIKHTNLGSHKLVSVVPPIGRLTEYTEKSVAQKILPSIRYKTGEFSTPVSFHGRHDLQWARDALVRHPGLKSQLVN